jgi:UDP-N-acetylmuramoyl-tripeptide--D-alanyl-D-alanine ligase
MRDRWLSEIAGALGARLVGADVRVRRVVVDSREAGPGDLFVALRGARTDGHSFVHDAFRRGASAALVRLSSPAPGPAIQVADTGDSLLRLAASERRALRARVIGITGSAGKTITKDLTSAALSRMFRVHASPRSFNNQVGLPLTILGADSATDVLVCEIGAGVVGEIAGLCDIARPAIGIVTNVGLAHVETFGSPRRIRRAKAELVRALPPNGLAILNADDPAVRRFASRTAAGIVTFGRSARAMVRAQTVRVRPDGRASFSLVADGRRTRVDLPAPGTHLVSNGLAAAACALALGVPAFDLADAIRTARLSPWRMELLARPDGVRILNDSYNANPASMSAALHALANAAGAGRAVAVLGPMAELGRWARREHRRIGKLAARLRIHTLVLVGSPAMPIGEGAVRAGMPLERVVWCPDVESALATARGDVHEGDVILVKGSRVAGLERLAHALVAPDPGLRGAGASMEASRSGAPGPGSPRS